MEIIRSKRDLIVRYMESLFSFCSKKWCIRSLSLWYERKYLHLLRDKEPQDPRNSVRRRSSFDGKRVPCFGYFVLFCVSSRVSKKGPLGFLDGRRVSQTGIVGIIYNRTSSDIDKVFIYIQKYSDKVFSREGDLICKELSSLVNPLIDVLFIFCR